MKENAMPVTIKETDYQKLVAPYKEDAFQALKELVSIPSVLDEDTKSEAMPFGKGVDEALNYVAKLGKKLGFSVDRCDNYITELTYGEGEKTFDIYAHCDVVPVKKENWHHDPFLLTLEEGNIRYGRGTSDDKGPGLSCLFAVKALRDNKRLGGYKLRFLFGGNEENDSLGLKHYFHALNKGYPTLGISPDADYPLIYAEKSIYAYEADYHIELPLVEEFALGAALNIVLASATVTLKGELDRAKILAEKYKADYPKVNISFDGDKITFLGHPYHGSRPWNGVNAGLHLLNFLGILFDKPELSEIFKDYEDGRGNHFGGNFKNVHFTESSYNVGRIDYKGNKLSLFVNVRFPSDRKVETVRDNLKKHDNANYTLLGGSDGFVADPESDFVKILLKSYQDETGDTKSKPEAIGGGTYARESKNSVAFGSQFPGRDYRRHGDDEFFPLSDFYDSRQIYAHAIDKISEYLRTGKKDF